MPKKLKSIILAGGDGTRLLPLTKITSKQLLPIYDKPMIFYPLTLMIESKIRDIAIITKSRDLPLYRNLIGDGSELGLNISYMIQDVAKGIAESFIICESFIASDNVCLILGDNLFHGDQISKSIFLSESGAKVFGCKVNDPQRYGVLEISNEGQPIKIIEKPKKFVSSIAITGLYCYDSNVVHLAKDLKPSGRNELEITDVNNAYLYNQDLEFSLLGSSDVWMDSGTYESLLDASNYVKTFQSRQNTLIGCPELASFNNGWISSEELLNLVKKNYKESILAEKIIYLAGLV
jgi:glucose-1-phosphate thymidylyltransferase